MGEPIIQADQSLLLNGDFSESITHWTKNPSNSRWVTIYGDMYGSEPIKYLSASNLHSAFQRLTVPKAISPGVRYVLSFLYENNHNDSGNVRISVEGSEQRQDIELPVKPASALEQRRFQAAQGQPLALDLLPCETVLDLELLPGQTLRVEISSPNNEANDFVSDIRVTRIQLLLHLDLPLQLQALQLDEESLPPDMPLHLCLGADFDSHSAGHRLRFSPTDDSDWLGTQAALTIQNNPQGAILPRPDWGFDQPLDNEWQLSCPLIGNDEPYLFTLQLLNQYTAQPYSLDVSLGHHRLAFRDALEAAYYPVLEYGQSVRLGVQVISWYTSQVLEGRTVNWAVEGQGFKAASNTDDNGWAYFDYLPMTDGDFTIVASVDSPYYQAGIVSETFAVKVLATDPWKELLAVTDAGQAPWPDRTGYPNRGANYPLQIKVPAVLQGTSLALAWSGDSPEQLGVMISPALDVPLPVDATDLSWTLTSEDRLDGLFNLQLSCSKLKLPSPFKRMSLARNVVRIGEVREANKYPVVDEEESVLLRVQVLHDVALGDGDPVVNALVEWELPGGELRQASTGTGGWASVLYTPTVAGDMAIVAKVRAHSEALAVERIFSVTALATSPWATAVRILLDETEVDRKVLGLLCWRGQSHTLKVEALPDSMLIGKSISLHWRGADPAIGLKVSGLESATPLPETGGLTWTLSSEESQSLSSLFDLKLTSEGITDRELSGRLIATDLSQEMNVVLDQVVAAPGQVLYPCLGALHLYSFRTHALSPLVGLGVPLACSVEPEELGATVEPPFGVEQVLTDGGASWMFDFSSSRAPVAFELHFFIDALRKLASNNQINLDHNRLKIEPSRELPVDPVVGQQPATLWTRVVSHYTEAPVEGAPVQWTSGHSSPTDAHGWSSFAFAPLTAGAHEVFVSVVSPYDGYEQRQSMSVMALANDPWASLSVRFDGGNAYPWGQNTVFPRRKGQHRIELLAPDDNPLIGRQLTLGMTGTGPAELDIRFESGKGLGTPLPFQGVGLVFPFVVGDVRDGNFSLQLAAERLVSLSPANAMSVGVGTQVLKFADSARARQVLDWNEELIEHVTLISSISGKPMVGIEVTWTHAEFGTQTSLTDFYGVARLRFTPRTPGASVLKARVGDEVYSESVGLDFTLNEPREISALYESVDSRLAPDVSKAHAHAKVVSALTGEPLAGVEVFWDYNQHELGSSWTDARGIADLVFAFVAEQAGVLTAIVKGGLAGWDSETLLITLRDDYWNLVEIQADPDSVYPGEFVRIWAKVQGRETGLPVEAASVHWTLAAEDIGTTSTGHDGKAHITYRPVAVGEHDLSATVVNLDESSKSLTLTVLHPATHPGHGKFEGFRALENPVGAHSIVKLEGFLVASATGEALPFKRLELRLDSQTPTYLTSNAEGKFGWEIWVREPGSVWVSVTFENPVGSPSNDSFLLTII
ncbi:hypothetical protein [Pseudomonas sp. PB106]|uniref:hypothetical protein n=1 Tax=Pseudomonas sp. PB106 TaxID=2494699 RepID=UPI00131D536C|nr:hypothetical protein [Pseudomonas sp. PB106]KAE9639224.1 hypothetical protein EJA71_25765 [Pseudomonas sp. PB106]